MNYKTANNRIITRNNQPEVWHVFVDTKYVGNIFYRNFENEITYKLDTKDERFTGLRAFREMQGLLDAMDEIIRPAQSFSVGDKIRLLSSPDRIKTEVDSIKWCEKNECWKYYFFDNEGNKWYDTDPSIELIKD